MLSPAIAAPAPLRDMTHLFRQCVFSMTFHSFEYLIFLPVAVALHFALPHRFRWILLLAASYVFYAAWRVDFLSLLILSTVTDYIVGRRLEAARREGERKAILCVSLGVNLGLLFVFKYIETLWNTIGRVATGVLTADTGSFSDIDIILPLGISFYTFQTLSYTIDIYRGRIRAERHLGYFALYVAFFPQLLAGPIERAGHLLREIRAPRQFNWEGVGTAYFLIVLGLAKKLVIADRLARIFAPIVEDPLQFSPLEVLLTPPATVYQYYCDLSGYADIAVGSAMLLGIRLSRNFDRPFAATSTMRFWYRWHITVTAWFRDYLLRPLAKQGSVATSRPVALMLTGLVIGLWHAPTLGWVVAGCSVGLLAIPEGKWMRWCVRNNAGPRTAPQRVLWGWAGRLYVWTIVFFLIGLPLTWGDMSTLTQVLGQIATLEAGDVLTLPAHTGKHWEGILLLFLSMSALEIWQWLDARGRASGLINALWLEARWLAATAFAIGVLVLSERGQSGFLYFKF